MANRRAHASRNIREYISFLLSLSLSSQKLDSWSSWNDGKKAGPSIGDHIKIKAVCEQQIFFSFFFFCFLLLLFTICTAREGRGGGRALLLCGNRGLVNRRYKIHRGKKQSTAIIGSIVDDDDDDDAS